MDTRQTQKLIFEVVNLKKNNKYWRQLTYKKSGSREKIFSTFKYLGQAYSWWINWVMCASNQFTTWHMNRRRLLVSISSAAPQVARANSEYLHSSASNRPYNWSMMRWILRPEAWGWRFSNVWTLNRALLKGIKKKYWMTMIPMSHVRNK